MKFKSTLSAAVLFAVLTTSTVQTPFTTGFAADAAASGRQLAAENGIVLSTDEAAASLSVLSGVNSGSLPELEFDASGNVTGIDGRISGKKVTCPQDAAAVVSGLSALLGIADFDSELVFDEAQDSLYNEVYRFRQVYRGIPVESGCVTLIVDKNTGYADYLGSSFAAGLSLDTVPQISAAAARTVIRNQCGVEPLANPELVVFRTDADEYRLAWSASTASTAASYIFVDAQDGRVLRRCGVSNYKKSQEGPYNEIVGTSTFWYDYGKDSYGNIISCDPSRNIWIVGQDQDDDRHIKDYYEYYENKGIPKKQYFFENSLSGVPSYISDFLGQKWLNEKVHKSNTLSNFQRDEQTAIGVVFQVGEAYDFYKNAFGWKGTDGKNSILAVNPNLNPYKFSSSFASPAGNFLGFVDYSQSSSSQFANKKCNDACSLDIVAHEYTHRVSISKAKWEKATNGCDADYLNEAYSDIMGEYCEGRMTWKTGEDSYKNGGYTRNLGVMTSTGKRVVNGKTYYYNLAALNEARNKDSVDCHLGSTVVSSAAYRMHVYGIPAKIAREIWFQSLDYYTYAERSTFLDCRKNVIKATSKVLSNHTELSQTTKDNYRAYVRMAFNGVGIKDPSIKMGDVNCDGKVNNTDVTYITLAARGRYTPSYEGRALGDVNYDGRVTTDDATLVNIAVIRNNTGTL